MLEKYIYKSNIDFKQMLLDDNIDLYIDTHLSKLEKSDKNHITYLTTGILDDMVWLFHCELDNIVQKTIKILLKKRPNLYSKLVNDILYQPYHHKFEKILKEFNKCN